MYGPTHFHSGEGGLVLSLVHSFSPRASLHMYRSVGRPLRNNKVNQPSKPAGENNCSVMCDLLICVSCDRVPALVLIDVNVPDISQCPLIPFVIWCKLIL